jgi:hypothetical protein
MKKILAAVLIVVSMAWNTNAILAAQPVKIGISYSSRSNSITPFHLAGGCVRFFAGEKFKVIVARRLI